MRVFRKNRKKQLASNNKSNYLLYALGEILLIVIGILIAFAVDDYKDKRIRKKQEDKTLFSLYESIKMNLSELEDIHSKQIKRAQITQEVLFFEFSSQDINYFDDLLSNGINNYTFDPSTGIYNSMISSGSLELISNDSLKSRISRLSDLINDYKQSEQEITEYSKLHLESYFIENNVVNPEVLAKQRTRSAKEIDEDTFFYKGMLDSQIIKNMYILLLKKMSVLINKGEQLRSEYIHLKNLLEKEMKGKSV